MASKNHQRIIGIIVRKMRQKEYEVVSFEGKEKIISDIDLRIPPKIIRHRPDVIGVNFKNNKLCIGEAKTGADLVTRRTQEQFSDFSDVLVRVDNSAELIIGIPKSAEPELIKLLQKLNLLENPNVSYVWMPDDLLDGDEEELDEKSI